MSVHWALLPYPSKSHNGHPEAPPSNSGTTESPSLFGLPSLPVPRVPRLTAVVYVGLVDAPYSGDFCST